MKALVSSYTIFAICLSVRLKSGKIRQNLFFEADVKQILKTDCKPSKEIINLNSWSNVLNVLCRHSDST